MRAAGKVVVLFFVAALAKRICELRAELEFGVGLGLGLGLGLGIVLDLPTLKAEIYFFLRVLLLLFIVDIAVCVV